MNHTFKFYLIALMVFVWPILAKAQDNVVVDMSVLENYSPPPMFDESIEVIPMDQPRQFPFRKNTTTHKGPSVYIHKTPPLPPRRPSVLNAPVSFVQSVRKSENMQPITQDKVPVITEQPKGLPAPDRDAKDITRDPLNRALSTPTAQDILKTIAKASEDSENLNTGPDISLYVRKKRANELPKDIQIISLAFAPEQTQVDDNLSDIIRKKALAILRDEPDLRIEVQSFAQSNDQGESSARRLSLSRAINIRAFLMEQQVDPKRIDLRALGENTSVEPRDRVDLLFVEPASTL